MLLMMSSQCHSYLFFFFSSRRRHTRCSRDWSSDVCSSDLGTDLPAPGPATYGRTNKWAAEMVLANVYLNAEVYTGTPHYDLALTAAENVINSGAYTLDTVVTFTVATPNPPVDPTNATHVDTVHTLRVFLADNDQSKEMIFPV